MAIHAEILFLFSIALLAGSGESLSVRFVTWNVLTNDWMDKKFDERAVRTLLGEMKAENKSLHNHDIYAVTVQENCYQCNEKNKEKLADVFLRVLRQFGPYRLVSISMTRNSNSCQWFACNMYLFGTTAMLVFARENLLMSDHPFHVNGCDAKLIHNAEKGIAGMRTIVKETGKSICFAGLHLDIKDGKTRRKCVTKFWQRAKNEYGWSDCQHVLMAGDFNTRPAPKTRDGPNAVTWEYFGDDYVDESLEKDEMRGARPWVGVRLLDHVVKESGHAFEEAPVRFLPTYSILPHAKCGGRKPCFKGTRNPGWTDRILCSGCQATHLYTSVHLGLSDHDPVVGVFEL